MTPSLLVVAAHPDDEVLGCGGTIAHYAELGYSVHIAFMADGVFSRGADPVKSSELSERRNAAQKACKILGAASVIFGDLPDNRLDSIALLDIIQPIEALIQKHRPQMVLTHHAGDLNIDHRRVCEALTVATRPQAGSSVKTVLYFEVPSSTEWQIAGTTPAFIPNGFVDISKTFAKKMSALDAYAAELRAWPHPRSRQGVEHLARWRGATIGVDAAEAYCIGRHIL